MADVASHRARRELIRRLLRTHLVSTQDELGELLKREGIDVTQATLSRDLAKLMARRVTLPDGGTVYELEGAKAPKEDALDGVRSLVTTVDDSDAIDVIDGPQSAVWDEAENRLHLQMALLEFVVLGARGP